MEREADAVADQIALTAMTRRLRDQRRLRLHRPPRDGGGRARRVDRDPNPADPFRGLYISDDRALELSRGDSVSDADDRLAQVTAALGLDLLDAAVLAICAAPELNPRYGRLYAYLQDDVTRKLPSPRLVGHLLSGEGVSAADVMMAFERDAPLRAKGAIRLQGDAQTPLAERPIKLSDRLAAHLLGVGMDDPPAGGKLRMVPHPDHDPGRDEAVAALAATLAHPSHAARSCSPARTPRRSSRRPTAARSWSRTSARSTSPRRWPRRR